MYSTPRIDIDIDIVTVKHTIPCLTLPYPTLRYLASTACRSKVAGAVRFLLGGEGRRVVREGLCRVGDEGEGGKGCVLDT